MERKQTHTDTQSQILQVGKDVCRCSGPTDNGSAMPSKFRK